jgi:DNA invertase Pin-like site-specific DNA recombinase
MSKQIISYIRVSTARQGKSGLGLEAQRASIARFAEAEVVDGSRCPPSPESAAAGGSSSNGRAGTRWPSRRCPPNSRVA